MSLHDDMAAIGDRALAASRKLALLSTEAKNAILLAMADALEADKKALTDANKKDIEAGKKAGLSAALLDRLLLNDSRIAGMTKGL
jgi:glutamate-5-semialdehyde dehydrogenase